MVNNEFIETMFEGDSNGRGFHYPIPTYSITKDFDWSDTENNRLLLSLIHILAHGALNRSILNAVLDIPDNFRK